MIDEPNDLAGASDNVVWRCWQGASVNERRIFLLQLCAEFLRTVMHDPQVTHFVCGVRTEADEDTDDEGNEG
jgi:hypothetical protein